MFQHLLAIIALYISAASFIVLLFNYINYFFPDPLHQFSDFPAIRWAIATLIIVFPVYALMTWYLNRAYRRTPELVNLRTRKWLVYLTMFLAAAIMLGDLVTLIFNFLSGELTTRFVLKGLVVLLVMAAIFVYYLWEVRRYKTD